MITGFLTGSSIQLRDEGEASTLRNKGYPIKRIKGGYSLDIISGAYLLRRAKLEIIQDGRNIDFSTIFHKLTFKQKMLFSTFEHLKRIGIKCRIVSDNLYVGNRKVMILHYGNQINFGDLNTGLLSIVDSDFESLIYEIKRKNLLKSKEIVDNFVFLDEVSKKFTIKSGAKFGSDYRLYSGKDKHSKILLNMKSTDDTISLIAKARVSHSVKKELVYCFPSEKEMKCLSFKWVH